MKRLMLVNSLDYGGLERTVYDIVKNYPERFIVACINKKGHFGELLEKEGFEVIELGKGRFQKIMQLRKIIKSKRIGVVLSENTAPMQLSVLSTTGLALKKIHVDHNSFAESPGLKTRIGNRIFSRSIDRFIAVSPEVKDKMVKDWDVDEGRINVILNGVDVKPVKTKKQRQNVVSVIAGLRKVKDHLTLLKAFKDIDAELWIIGDGLLRKDIEDAAFHMGIDSKVRMLGWRDDIPELIMKSDVVVCSSLSEGISITLLEAMALGKPIIATDVGGNRVIVKGNGLLFKPKDHHALNRHLKKLLSDKKLAAEMGKRGRKRIDEYFNVKRMVEEYWRCAG